VLEFNRLCDMQPDDQILLVVPMFHCFGQNALLNSALNAGSTLVMQRGFDLNESKRLISAYGVTQLYGVPTFFQLLHESCSNADLSSVRYCFSAAATLPRQVSERWLEKFRQPIYEGYGLTETSPFASYNHHENYVLGSIGAPIDSVEMRIVDSETGMTCPPEKLGEIAIRGPNVMLGYWKRPKDTATAIRNGWFYSGDIGRRDANGYFYIVDRVKDMISTGGLKVYPAEVERVLLDHPAISQAAVVGFPDEVFGEHVVAFLVLADHTSELNDTLTQELMLACRQNLANYKVPKTLVALNALPLNPSGKVLKRQLREYDLSSALTASDTVDSVAGTAEIGARTPQASSPLRSPTLWNELNRAYASSRLDIATQFVQDLVRGLTGEDQSPALDARLLEVGLDSLMIVEISAQIQAEIGDAAHVSPTLVFDYPRIGDLAGFLLMTFETAKADQQAAIGQASVNGSYEIQRSSALRQEIEKMSEEEALNALMQELTS